MESSNTLRDAVVAAVLDQYPEDGPAIVTDVLVIYARQGYDEDGEGETAIGWFSPGVPHYRIVGLADAVLTAMRARFAAAVNEDEG